MPVTTNLPSLPQSSMHDERGAIRPEWRQYLAALDKVVRQLVEG